MRFSRYTFWRVIKIMAILGCIAAVFMIALSKMGGSSESHKSGIESYLSEISGKKVHIGHLQNMQFFPTIHFDFSHVEFTRPDSEEATPVMTIENARLAMGFWDMIRSTGKIKNIYIEGLHADPGVLLPDGVSLDRVEVVPVDAQGVLTAEKKNVAGYRMMAKGHVGERALDIGFPVESSGDMWKQKFFLGLKTPVVAVLGDIQTNAVLDVTNYPAKVNDITVMKNGQNILSGAIVLKGAKGGDVLVEMTGKSAEFESEFINHIYLKKGEEGVTGRLEVTKYQGKDFMGGSRLMTFLEEMVTLFMAESHRDETIAMFRNSVSGLQDSCGAWDYLVLDGKLGMEPQENYTCP